MWGEEKRNYLSNFGRKVGGFTRYGDEEDILQFILNFGHENEG